jgi:hypothetical protein
LSSPTKPSSTINQQNHTRKSYITSVEQQPHKQHNIADTTSTTTSKMKFPSFTFALAATASLVHADDWANAVKCAEKNPDINTAIQQFCSKGDIMSPSHYAHKGKHVNGVGVRIGGHCSPAEWVPPNYCTSQFHQVCAHHKHGHGHQHYGTNGCQKFHIGKVHVPLPNPMGGH